MALVSFSGTSRRLAWVSCSSTALRRLFLVGSDSAISQQRNAESRAALEQGGLRAGSTKLLLHIEHGRRPLLKPVRVGLREQGCVAGAVCFTCNKGNAIKIARTWADMPPTFLRARTEALQTARPLCAHISVRSDRLFQTLLFWILRVCAARSH